MFLLLPPLQPSPAPPACLLPPSTLPCPSCLPLLPPTPSNLPLPLLPASYPLQPAPFSPPAVVTRCCSASPVGPAGRRQGRDTAPCRSVWTPGGRGSSRGAHRGMDRSRSGGGSASPRNRPCGMREAKPTCQAPPFWGELGSLLFSDCISFHLARGGTSCCRNIRQVCGEIRVRAHC